MKGDRVADVEAVLIYRPSGFEGQGEFRLARTSAASAIRAVATAAVAQAREAAALYRGIDPALEAATAAEADRLEAVLRQIDPACSTPPEPTRPRLVHRPRDGDSP
jgi:hypothetical protein